MTANDNNDVALLAEVFRFLLPRPRRITYCIKNSGVCIGFFEKLRTFLPFCYLKCGLCNRKNGLLGVRRAFPGLQLVQIAEHKYLSPGMAHDALHLGVGSITGHQKHRALGLGPGGNALDLLHKGAGGIVVNKAALLQSIIDGAGHAVAADDDLVPGGDIVHGIGHQRTAPFHIGHRLRVMDQRAQRCHLMALVQQIVGQLHRAVHAKAEAGGFGKTNFHSVSPSLNLSASHSLGSSPTRGGVTEGDGEVLTSAVPRHPAVPAYWPGAPSYPGGSPWRTGRRASARRR